MAGFKSASSRRKSVPLQTANISKDLKINKSSASPQDRPPASSTPIYQPPTSPQDATYPQDSIGPQDSTGPQDAVLPQDSKNATMSQGPQDSPIDRSIQDAPIATKSVSTPGALAPKTGEPDPNKFGGTPFGQHAGAGGAKGAAASGGNKFARYMMKHPKGAIWGAVSLVGVLGSIVIALLSIPFQLIHMAKILMDHNFGPGDRIEQKAGRRVLARIFQEKTTESGGAKKATGHPIADKIANMRMDRFNSQLARDGLKLEFDATGKLSGIRNLRDNTLLKDFTDSTFAERRTAVGDLVSERIAPWRVLKRVSYTRLMRYHARVSFKFFTKEKVKDIRDVMLEKVRQGAAPSELAQPPSKPDPGVATDGTGDAADAIKVTESTFTTTKNKVLAVRAGAESIRASGGKFFGITGMLALVCLVKEMADKAATQGYLDRVDQLMRVGNMLPTMVAQLYTGQYIDFNAFGQLMSVFTGDPNAPATSVDRKGWDQSAAAKRINNEPVQTNPMNADKTVNVHYNPDLSEAANPNGFLLKKIVDVVDAIFAAIPGFNLACAVVNSFFGWLIQGLELVAAVFTAGTAELAAIAVQAVAQFVIFNEVLPKVLSAGANLAITGTENSVDAFNNSDAGLQLSSQDYARSYGGGQMSDSARLALVNDASQAKIQIAREKGWFYRMFSLDNTDSVASNMLMKIPTTPSTALAALSSLPRNFTTNLGAIFFGSLRPAYAGVPVNVNPYQFQFYGFTQAEIDKYPDPIANEAYLAQPVPGETDPHAGGRTRLSILGDSSEYSPEDGDDTNTDDLLHCFVNKYRSPSDLALDPICAGIGSVTAPNDNVTPYTGSSQNNPNDATVQAIYDKAGLKATVNDDFLRYRLQLFYTHLVRGAECASNTIDCFTASSSTSNITPPGNPPTAQVQSLAAQILANTNVTYWSDNGVDSRDVFVALAAGRPAYTTCANANGANPDVNPNILLFILAAAGKTHIMIDSLTDKCHVAGSPNYTGSAVDLNLSSGPLSILVPIATQYHGTQNADTTHYHFDFPK